MTVATGFESTVVASPSKPVENAFVESFKGKFREECLSEVTVR